MYIVHSTYFYDIKHTGI